MNREWNGSEVMKEYARIASDSGLVATALLAPEKDARKPVGNPDKTPETPTRNEKTEQYDIKPEGAGVDMVQKAHPKEARPAEAMGDGALVETITQQQEKDVEVATSIPHGMLLGRHAAMVEELVKLANALDERGEEKAARRVDAALRRIAALPFDNGLRKEAIAPLVIGAIVVAILGALGGTAAFGEKMTSLREKTSTDLQDILETLGSVDDPRLAEASKELKSLLTPYVSRFARPYPSTKDRMALQQYVTETQNFKSQVMPRAEALLKGLAAGGRWYWPFGPKRRLAAKWEDIKSSIDIQMAELRALETVGTGMIERGEVEPGMLEGKAPSAPAAAATVSYTGSKGIKGLQEILRSRGLQVPITGKLDRTTTEALRFLEQQLEVMLAPILKRKGWKVRGMILKPDGTTMDPAMLKDLLSAADAAAGK